jgi:hypothetical protein
MSQEPWNAAAFAARFTASALLLLNAIVQTGEAEIKNVWYEIGTWFIISDF